MINRGYYTVARRYEFYVRVARTISHEWAKRTTEILFLPREHKIHIFELTCNFFYHTNILMKAFSMIFRRFPTLSEDFSNSLRIPEHFQRLPKTFKEDPKIFRWYTNCFKYNLRDKLDTSEIIDIFTYEDIISSHVRISYVFMNLLPLGIPLTFI